MMLLVLMFPTGNCRQQDVWNAIIGMIKSLQEVLLSSLPNFWRVARDFTDGKFKKVWRVHFSPLAMHLISFTGRFERRKQPA